MKVVEWTESAFFLYAFAMFFRRICAFFSCLLITSTKQIVDDVFFLGG